MATTVIAVAAVIGAGVSIYNAANAPKAPKPQAPPTPGGYEEYDDEGNLLTIQEWDAERNAYVTRFDPKPEQKNKGNEPPGELTNYGAGKEPKPSEFSEGWDHDGLSRKSAESFYDDAHRAWKNKYSKGLNSWESWTKGDGDYQKKYKAWEERTATRKKDKDLRKSIRTNMLANLDKTPEDRVAAYEDYAKTFSDAIHQDVDERYSDVVRASEEEMSARGLYGSRAYTDRMLGLQEDKTDADIEISEKANLAKEQLADSDRNYWLNVLGQMDSGMRSDALVQQNKARTAQTAANQGTAATMGNYVAQQNNVWNKWGADMQRSQQMTRTASDTATGLAFLYGYKGGGTQKTPLLQSNNSANLATQYRSQRSA